MPKVKVQPKPLSGPPPDTAISLKAVQEILIIHLDRVRAIVQDNDITGDPGFMAEIKAAAENAQEALSDVNPASFATLLNGLKDLSSEEVDGDALLKLVGDIDESAIDDLVEERNSGAMVIDVPDLARRMKLEAFLTTEIYPLYADQKAHLDFVN